MRNINSGFKGYLTHLINPSPKSKRNPPTLPPSKKKNSLYFGKWNFLSLRLNLFLHFHKWNPELFNPNSKNKKLHPKKISYSPGNGNPPKILMFSQKQNKIFSYFGKQKPQKCVIYFSKVLRFQEVTFCAQKIKSFLYFSL